MTGRLGRLTALCALAVAMLGGTAQGQDLPFSASPGAVTLADDGSGSVAISNDSGIDLDLSYAVRDRSGQAVPGASVEPGANGKLGPGGTAPLKVMVPPPATSATLVVVAAPTNGFPQGGVLRIPLSTVEAAKPAVADWTYIQRHAAHDGGTALPLTGPCKSLGLSGPKRVGTVQGGGERLEITGSCQEGEPNSLVLATSRTDSTGRTYKGTLKVGETDVALTVEDTVSWALAALLILVGIVLALGIGAWRGWGRASQDLLRKSYLIEQMVTSGNEANVDGLFADAAAKLGLPANVRAWTVAVPITEKLAALRASVRGFPKEAQLDAVRKELDVIELQVRGWPEVANLLGRLVQQNVKLVGLDAYRRRIAERTLERKGPISLAAMADVKAAAEEATGLAAEWPTEAIEAAREMAQDLAPGEPARASWEAVLDRFMAVTSPVDARVSLEDFWQVNEELRRDAAPAGFAEAAVYKAVAPQRAGFFDPVETGDPADAARGLALRITLIDTWILAVLLLAALFAGMQALWIDKSFGGTADVIAALIWGLGAATVGQPLSAALGDVGRSWLASNAGGGT